MTERLRINDTPATNTMPETNVKIFTPRELSVIGRILNSVGLKVSHETNERMNNILKLMLIYGFLMMVFSGAMAGATHAANMKYRGAYDHKHQVTLLQYLAALTPMILKVAQVLSGMGPMGGAAIGAMFGVLEKRTTEFFTPDAHTGSMENRFKKLFAMPNVRNAIAAGHGGMAGAGLVMASETAAGAAANVTHFLQRGVGKVITSKMPDFASVLSQVASDRSFAERTLTMANAATGRMVSGSLINIMITLYGYTLTLCNSIGLRVSEVIIMTLIRRYKMLSAENDKMIEGATQRAIRGTGGGGNQVMRLGAPSNNMKAAEELRGMNGNNIKAAEALMGLRMP